MAGALALANLQSLMIAVARQSLRQSPIYRIGDDAFHLNDETFVSYFRLTKELAAMLCEELRSDLEPHGSRHNTLTVEKKVLSALRFYATGSYQQCIANDYCLQLSQPSVSRSVRQVSAAITRRLFKKWVKFPTSSSDLQEKKTRFMVKSGFPGVIGAIDCTHIEITTPPKNDPVCPEHIFVNRHNTHSVYAQMVCDYDLIILSCNVRYPGCTHDSFIWRNSGLRRKVQTIAAHNDFTWLIGDSGYPLEPWLMVPIQVPGNAREQGFNDALSKGRNPIERCFGVLKSRFRCLLGERVLHHYPTVAASITTACVTLHNICKLHGMPDVDIVPPPYIDPPLLDGGIHQAALGIRQHIIQNYF